MILLAQKERFHSYHFARCRPIISLSISFHTAAVTVHRNFTAEFAEGAENERSNIGVTGKGLGTKGKGGLPSPCLPKLAVSCSAFSACSAVISYSFPSA